MKTETETEHVACPVCRVVSAVEVKTAVMGGGQAVQRRFEHDCMACGATFDQDGAKKPD